MDDFIFDVGGIPDAPLFETLDEGIYPVQISKIEQALTKNGFPQVAIHATVTEGGPVQKSGSVSVGRNITQFLTFKEGPNAQISKATLKDLFKKTNREWPETGRLDLSVLVGAQVQFMVKIRQYNGDDRNDVKGYKALA